MADLQIDIVTPRKAVFSGKAASAVLPAWDGQLGVLPGHDALLALLRGGVLELKGGDGDKRFAVGRGFVEIGGDTSSAASGGTRVTVLADTCELATDVNKGQAQKDADDAVAKMQGLDTNGLVYGQLEEKLEVARARLAV